MARPANLKCLSCGMFFGGDPRNARHQKYCAAPACRQASKTASQRAWLAKAENQDYFRGLLHLQLAQLSGSLPNLYIESNARCGTVNTHRAPLGNRGRTG